MTRRLEKYFPIFVVLDRRLGPVVRWVAWGLLIIVVLVVVGWLYFSIKFSCQLHSEIAALQAQEIPLSMVAAAPAPVPDDQNAAVVYQQVFQADFDTGKTNNLLSSDEHQLFFHYVSMQDRELESSVRSVLARTEIQQTLQTLTRAVRRPCCVFPAKWGKGLDAQLPHLSACCTTSQIVAAQALLCAHDGAIQESLHWCWVGLRMFHHMGSEPTWPAQDASYYVEGMIIYTLEYVISSVPVPPRLVRQLDRCLASLNLYDRFTAAMIAERAMVLDVFREVPEDPGPYSDMAPLASWYGCWFAGPLLKFDKLSYITYMDAIIRCSSLPYYQSRPYLEHYQHTLDNSRLYQAIVTRLAATTCLEAAFDRDRAVAEIYLGRVALALKDYKYRHGTYPDSLQQLQQILEWQIPPDPFSGQDLVYRRIGPGFKLYAIGSDEEDDGGLSEWAEDKSWHGTETDIVWECER